MRWCPQCGREKELHDRMPWGTRECLLVEQTGGTKQQPISRADDAEYTRRRAIHAEYRDA